MPKIPSNSNAPFLTFVGKGRYKTGGDLYGA